MGQPDRPQEVIESASAPRRMPAPNVVAGRPVHVASLDIGSLPGEVAGTQRSSAPSSRLSTACRGSSLLR